MTRKLYTVSSWDRTAGKGIATDGTQWEGEAIPFVIYAGDLDDSYNDFLVPGETITALEHSRRGEIALFDILVESGPRSVQPAPPATAATPAFDPNPPERELFQYDLIGKPEKTLGELYIELATRVESLEHQVFGGENEEAN